MKIQERDKEIKRLERKVFIFWESKDADKKYFIDRITQFICTENDIEENEWGDWSKYLWTSIWINNDSGKTAKYLYFNERTQKLFIDRDFRKWADLMFDKINEEMAELEAKGQAIKTDTEITDGLFSNNQTSNMKKILYIDMDGVVADFDKGVRVLCPELDTKNFERDFDKVNEVCESNPNIFHNLEPIEGSIDAVNELFELFEVYFLSTPMWNVPDSFTGKRIWLENHFGQKCEKRLILTHRKDLCIGDFLIDDSTRNGAGNFKGTHIHIHTPAFPYWNNVIEYLKNNK